MNVEMGRFPLNKASANDAENATIALIFHFQFSILHYCTK